MRVAVTGSTGFIGRYVLQELLSRSNIDSIVATGRAKNRPSIIPEGCDYEFLDIAQPLLGDYERLGRPDVLIHLAWGGLPNYRSLHHFESELPRQYAFLNSLLNSGLQSLLVTGTCFEYGMASGELNEAMAALPTNPYGFAKNSLREQLEYRQEKSHFNLTWTRLFYLYGDGQAPSSLYSQLMKAINLGEKSFNMSKGEQIRDFLDVKLVAKYLVDIAIRKENDGIVNICSGNPISIRSLVEQWISKRQSSIGLNLGYFHYTEYEPMAFWGSSAKLYKLVELS